MGVGNSGSSPHRPTKIAVLIPTLEFGGAEQDVVRNFPRLNRDEFEVVVVLFDYPGALAPELERQGVRYVARRAVPGPTAALPDGPPGAEPRASAGESLFDRVRRWVKTYRVLAPLLWLGRRVFFLIYVSRVTLWVGSVFARERVDVAHFFLPHSYAYGMLACALRRRHAKTVMSRLSLNFYKGDQPRLAWLERHVLHRRVDIAIGNSKLILDELAEEGAPRDRLRLLYNGIDLTPFVRGPADRVRAREVLTIAPNAFVMVAVGNLWAHKGHGDLIEACALASEQLPEQWLLLIAGRDQEGNRAAYERLIADHGLTDNVRLLGETKDIPTLLAAADLFVQPSRHEGLPNAIVEAMAASLPVVATAVGGIPEVVVALAVGGMPEVVTAASQHTDQPAATGWLVPPHDPEALSAALLEASRNPSLRKAMGARARARAEAEFSLDRSVRDYEAIYREVTR